MSDKMYLSVNIRRICEICNNFLDRLNILQYNQDVSYKYQNILYYFQDKALQYRIFYL